MSSQALSEVTAAYPKDKLSVVRKKLTGMNPVSIMLSELKPTRHKDQPYYHHLVQTVKCDFHIPRHGMSTGILSLCEQVDALIDMALF